MPHCTEVLAQSGHSATSVQRSRHSQGTVHTGFLGGVRRLRGPGTVMALCTMVAWTHCCAWVGLLGGPGIACALFTLVACGSPAQRCPWEGWAQVGTVFLHVSHVSQTCFCRSRNMVGLVCTRPLALRGSLAWLIHSNRMASWHGLGLTRVRSIWAVPSLLRWLCARGRTGVHRLGLA